MYRFLILITVITIFFGCNRNETPKPDTSRLFIKFFGGAFDDNGFSVIQSEDGGYYLSGSTLRPGRLDTCVYVAKIDVNGNKVWDKSYDFNDSYDEVSRDLIVNKNGDLIVVGYKYNSNLKSDILVIRITNDNPDSFTKYTFGAASVSEKGLALVQDDVDDEYILMGNSTTSELSSSDMFFLKTDLTDTTWLRKIGSLEQDDLFGKLKKNSSKNLVWCGTSYTYDASNMVLTFADNFGNLLFNRAFKANDNIYQYGYDMDLLSNDDCIIAGSKRNKTTQNRDIFIVRTDKAGKLVNTTDTLTISPGISQEALSIIVNNDNEYVITGYIVDDKGSKDIYVAKIAKDGTIIKSNTFGFEGDDIGVKIIKSKSGGYFVIGTINAFNNKMIGTYKLNEDLNLVN